MSLSDGPLPLDFLLVQVCRLHHYRAHTLFESIGLYRGQPPVLGALWESEGLTHSELAKRMNVTPATMTRLLQRMEKAGLLQRRMDAEDQRVSRVYLTAAGKAIQEKVKAVWKQMDADAFASLTAEERETLHRLLEKVRDNLRKAADETCL